VEQHCPQLTWQNSTAMQGKVGLLLIVSPLQHAIAGKPNMVSPLQHAIASKPNVVSPLQHAVPGKPIDLAE